MRLVAYLPGADYKVRMEEEIEDNDYLARPEFYQTTLKDRLMKEFGSGKTKTGLSWEWSPQIKRQVDVKVEEPPRFVMPVPSRVGRPSIEVLRAERVVLFREAEKRGLEEQRFYDTMMRIYEDTGKIPSILEVERKMKRGE